jgi:hypothetical protein
MRYYGGINPGITKEGSIDWDRLLGGDELPFLTTTVTVLKGQNLKRGSVLGLITTTGKDKGKAKLTAKASTDGSQNPRYILVTDLNASGEDLTGVVYKMGIFNENYLTFGASTKVSDMELALEDRNIHLLSGMKQHEIGDYE